METLLEHLLPVSETAVPDELAAYIRKRRLSQNALQTMFYVDNLQEWVTSARDAGTDVRISLSRSKEIDEACLPWLPYYPATTLDPRITALKEYAWLRSGFLLSTLRSRKGSLEHIICRSLAPDTDGDRRFVWICHPQGRSFGETQVIGLESLDFEREIVLVEGVFDRFHVDNAIAFLGSANLWRLLAFFTRAGVAPSSIRIVLDNEPYRAYLRVLERHLLHAGYSVFFWPSRLKEHKDLQDLAEAGYSKPDIEEVLKAGFVEKTKSSPWFRALLKSYACQIRHTISSKL